MKEADFKNAIKNILKYFPEENQEYYYTASKLPYSKAPRGKLYTRYKNQIRKYKITAVSKPMNVENYVVGNNI